MLLNSDGNEMKKDLVRATLDSTLTSHLVVIRCCRRSLWCFVFICTYVIAVMFEIVRKVKICFNSQFKCF